MEVGSLFDANIMTQLLCSRQEDETDPSNVSLIAEDDCFNLLAFCASRYMVKINKKYQLWNRINLKL